ncbi:uncharacterized protein HMPREF1541_03172 [Cyphellophora europaea CBS 101466]|uniref:AB hydrolase-1 domain-containing protein n=1 Tax=Cyphellophora europaea (strain CBS 101466) TaxID=1220924 RepID=W2RXR2_CYPE1|nr:uncharacterized protein HMPREF1541_03172 [Cyphellophora europaea CBS 101466]ETN41237.1 hypothetical protein HMPREF1541_03172 [Cyphellophora europaea CBS 101466]
MAAPTSTILPNGIHALSSGARTNPAIVCLPGWPETASAYLPLLPLLSPAHFVLILDPPGLGASAPFPTSYTTTATATHLLTAIQAALGPHTPYHLIGHDIGSWLAFPLAHRDSPHILSLTLMDSLIPGLAPPQSWPLPYEANIRLWQFTFNALPDLPEILVEGKEKEVLDWLFDRKAAHPERITPERRAEYVSAYSKEGGMARGFAYYRAVSESAVEHKRLLEEAGKLRVPVLCVGGGNGTGATMRDIAEVITTETARSRFVLLQDCGHYVMEEQPEQCADAILEFVGRVKQE